MIEKFWSPVAPVSLTAPGTAQGEIQVASTLGFRVKMLVALTDPSFAPLKLEVKRVNSPTSMELGPFGQGIDARSNLSSYGATSSVFSIEQGRVSIPIQELTRATYEEEPVVAWRTLLVDMWGRPYSRTNPFPSLVSDGSEILSVNPDGSINVNVVDSSSMDAHFADASVPTTPGSQQDLISETVPAGFTRIYTAAKVACRMEGSFRVLAGAAIIGSGRTGAASPNADFRWTPGRPVPAGTVVKIVFTARSGSPVVDVEAYLQASDSPV